MFFLAASSVAPSHGGMSGLSRSREKSHRTVENGCARASTPRRVSLYIFLCAGGPAWSRICVPRRRTASFLHIVAEPDSGWRKKRGSVKLRDHPSTMPSLQCLFRRTLIVQELCHTEESSILSARGFGASMANGGRGVVLTSSVTTLPP